MTSYKIDFSPYDYRIEIDADSPEEAVEKFKNMNAYDIMSNADRLDGLHTPLEPFLVWAYAENEDDLISWIYDPGTEKWIQDS